jgi:hypothetical protein
VRPLGKLTVVSHRVAAGLRRALGFALIMGLLISAVAFYRAAPELPRSAPTTVGSPASPASTATAQTPSPSESTTSPKPAGTAPPARAKLPKGPGTTEPGILLMASPLPNGSFDIAEMVLLPSPSSSLALAPPDLTGAGSRFAKAKPTASQVQVSAGDQPVMVPGGRVNRSLDLAWSEPARRIELRYNLSGITLRNVPSRAGRALTAISPLTAGVSNTFPVALKVGGTVLNIECPALARRQCASGRAPRLHLERNLPRSGALIVVQFDLPRPQ